MRPEPIKPNPSMRDPLRTIGGSANEGGRKDTVEEKEKKGSAGGGKGNRGVGTF